MLDPAELAKSLSVVTGMKENRFHPFVWIVGDPQIGKGVYIGGFSEVNAKDVRVVIGDFCDIASFVSINSADSHELCIGLSMAVARADITQSSLRVQLSTRARFHLTRWSPEIR